MVHKPIITKAGTELPLIDLKGKPYLQVAYRLVWFREEHPAWGIETSEVASTDKSAKYHTVIKDETGRIISSGTKTETEQGFPDFVEKAETGSVGRALAHLGYGTQFAPELDEGDRLADAQVIPAKPLSRAGQIVANAAGDTGKANAAQLTTIADLAVKKLGAKKNNGADILASLNAEFKLNLVSSSDLTMNKANTLIKALEAKPDFELPDMDAEA